jgi:hypothetical protein
MAATAGSVTDTTEGVTAKFNGGEYSIASTLYSGDPKKQYPMWVVSVTNTLLLICATINVGGMVYLLKTKREWCAMIGNSYTDADGVVTYKSQPVPGPELPEPTAAWTSKQLRFHEGLDKKRTLRMEAENFAKDVIIRTIGKDIMQPLWNAATGYRMLSVLDIMEEMKKLYGTPDTEDINKVQDDGAALQLRGGHGNFEELNAALKQFYARMESLEMPVHQHDKIKQLIKSINGDPVCLKAIEGYMAKNLIRSERKYEDIVDHVKLYIGSGVANHMQFGGGATQHTDEMAELRSRLDLAERRIAEQTANGAAQRNVSGPAPAPAPSATVPTVVARVPAVKTYSDRSAYCYYHGHNPHSSAECRTMTTFLHHVHKTPFTREMKRAQNPGSVAGGNPN